MNSVIDACFPTNWYVLTSSEWASWVQAVGSIIALAVAIFVMSRQNKHAAKLVVDADRLAILTRARSVHAILVRAIVTADMVGEAIEKLPTNSVERDELARAIKLGVHRFDELLLAIRSIPIYDLGSSKMAHGVFQILDSTITYHFTLTALHAETLSLSKAEIVITNSKMSENMKSGMRNFEGGMKELAP